MSDDKAAGIGHNSETLNSPAAKQLRTVVDRIERLETEKAEIAEQVKEVYAEAKGNGFDTRILRKVVARRRQDRARLAEEEALIELYETAIISKAGLLG